MPVITNFTLRFFRTKAMASFTWSIIEPFIRASSMTIVSCLNRPMWTVAWTILFCGSLPKRSRAAQVGFPPFRSSIFSNAVSGSSRGPKLRLPVAFASAMYLLTLARARSFTVVSLAGYMSQLEFVDRRCISAIS